jgi:hypothetical protein
MRNPKRKRTTSSTYLITKTQPSEHDEQVGFVNWFRAKYPKVLIFAIPNGGKRSVGAGRKLKAEGVVAGIPDLFIPAWDVWIEMKRSKAGRLSPDQKKIIEYLESEGYKVIVAKGATDASKQIMEARDNWGRKE